MKKLLRYPLTYLFVTIALAAILCGDLARGLHERSRQVAALKAMGPSSAYSVGFRDRALILLPFVSWEVFQTPERLSFYRMPPADLMEQQILKLTDLNCLDCNGVTSSARENNHGVTDAHLKVIEMLPKLEIISLYEANVSDEGLATFHVQGNEYLRWLSISASPSLTVDGLEDIDRFSQLKEIALIDLRLDDQVIQHLKDFPSIQTIKLWSCGVSPEAAQRLQTHYGEHVKVSWSEYAHEPQEELDWKGRPTVEN